jgi:hypothetical protein
LLFSRGRTLRLCFLRVNVTLFLAGGHKVCLLQAVKVWPLQGPNPHKFHLYARHNHQALSTRKERKSDFQTYLLSKWRYYVLHTLKYCTSSTGKIFGFPTFAPPKSELRFGGLE